MQKEKVILSDTARKLQLLRGIKLLVTL